MAQPCPPQPCPSCQIHLANTSCEKCSPAAYCSPTCRASNVILHRLLCKPYWSPMRPPRKPNATLGLFIPAENGPPTFRFVRYERDEHDIVRPDLKHLLGTDDPVRTLLSWSVTQNKELPYTLQLYQRAGKQMVNNFAYEAAKGTGYERHWGGAMVVLATKYQACAMDEPVWRDVGVEDLRWMFDYWRYGDEPLPFGGLMGGKSVVTAETVISGVHIETAESGLGRSPTLRNIKAVVIACIEERKARGTFVEMSIGIDHPIFRESPTQISKKMKLPLLMHKFPVQAIGAKTEDSVFRNPEASAMQRILDLDDPGWGLVADEYFGNIGSVLVVRADRKDLDAKQLDMLIGFCVMGLGYHMDLAMKDDNEELKKGVTNDLTSKAVFNGFFEEKRRALRWRDASWENVKSPYDV
ncbi:uncharacterized protein PAC_13905 [Phialocephala subalpina]|uniref:MYND-type domain-containing protein n=1 Tax=Phialocephala subalpina TaxID=576137 RepID=A0A1L7XG77_9HELO|nr:uncharacterized protein PAC_13905 [Phialocephala subalpina]